tara:strand:+ start:19 stop:270 length:252 start_codon:yes stop_codon:yes gene_type:complete
VLENNFYKEENMNISQYVNATDKEINNIKCKLMDSIEFNFTERECLILYRLAAFDLLPSTESKLAIMLMAQKLGNIPIPKEDV